MKTVQKTRVEQEKLLKRASQETLANAQRNIKLLFEIIDQQVELHTCLKQVYLFDFSLDDNELRDDLRQGLKKIETDLEAILAN